MMVEFKWISLFLTAVLQFTAAAETLPHSLTVRVGDEVTLPCQNKCVNATWSFSGSGNTTVELIKLENTKAKSDRLSVTKNCSLVIKKVTVEDAGVYMCRQIISGEQQDQHSQIQLFVIIKIPDWAQFMILAVVIAAILIIGVALISWTIAAGKNTQMDKNNVTVETSQDTADPEDGVSYASISFTRKTNSKGRADPEDRVSYAFISYTRKTNSKGRVLGEDGDDEDDDDDDDNDDDAYSTIKASSSSAGASADPSDLYATVNKPNKKETTV